MGKKWYVSLGDGEYIELDNFPIVFLATDENNIKMNGICPADCQSSEADKMYDTHIHIKDLVEQSHWYDSCDLLDERHKAHT